MTAGPPVSDRQKRLLANLLRRRQVTIEQLRDAHVETMSATELSHWLNERVPGLGPDNESLSLVDELFAAVRHEDESARHAA